MSSKHEEPTKKPTTASSVECDGCGKTFPSRNAVFKHLKDTDGSCLSKKDYQDFIRYVRTSTKLPKVVVLYGYLPFNNNGCNTLSSSTSSSISIRDGQDAGKILLQTIHQLQNEIDGIDDDDNNNDGKNSDNDDYTSTKINDSLSKSSIYKINRSYGYFSRSAECAQQDKDTATQTEVMAVRLPPLRKGVTIDDWLDQIQYKLDEKFQQEREEKRSQNMMTDSEDGNDDDDDDDYCRVNNLTPIRIIGRQDMPNPKFNAEMDVTYRRVEYLLPVDMLTWSIKDPNIRDMVQKLPIFADNHKHDMNHVNEEAPQLEDSARTFMLESKNIMRLLTTRIVKLDLNDKGSVIEKGFILKKKNQNKIHLSNRQPKKKKTDLRENVFVEEEQGDNDEAKGRSTTASMGDTDVTAKKSQQQVVTEETVTASDQSTKLKKGKKTNVLRRKRYHNFTEKLMAHDYLAYRRLDRIYHRSTIEFPVDNNKIFNEKCTKKASMDTETVVNDNGIRYIVLSISGDLFLAGQVCRIVGVLLALINGIIDKEFVECVFDENYPHLIPTPPAPTWGMISSEIHYAKQEGKTKCILSPRVTNQHNKGWNKPRTLRRVKDWQREVYKYTDHKWKEGGRDEDGRLVYEQEWTENVLLPWAEKAKHHLEAYRCWKRNHMQASILNQINTLDILKDCGMETSAASDDCPVAGNTQIGISSIQPIISIDSTVPEVFQKVVYNLQKLDTIGEWPTTSSSRQLVMVSTLDDLNDSHDQKLESFSVACSETKRNIQERSSAYSFAEGHGGASGSFSAGIMPGARHKQPKANSMFPDLVKAAFELELKLFPGREPSSTIAINRNAQFRPHTDSGAGAGQSTSLIVGLGTYSGGELIVEGEQHDIRYKGIEFDGWKQRHWTMPFKGERYSLVWFTPKGCEGMRGVDLNLK
mmetsp:Transcript_46876/g.52927  ORF Transcript_46876/g.52927 Transcript_46876/m.52927 type:complete len:923 (-) Transcript_46876:83-2851(-)